MIQSILFFTLGFLCAGFLALMIAPAIWRRAVALTRKRIEATVPLTLTEIQADKDRLRAEFAMSTRRLEMSVKGFREKAAVQIVEITRGRAELKALSEERTASNQALTELEAKSSEMRAELREREAQLERTSEKLAEAERAVEQRARELDKLGRLYDEASFSSSSRQIELVARESEVEKLSTDVTTLRAQHKKMSEEHRQMAAENRMSGDALKSEKRKSAELEKKIERMLETVSDREQRLDRREKELARLREQVESTSRAEDELNSQLLKAQGEKLRLESEHADLTLQMSRLVSGAKNDDIEKAMKKITAARDKLEERLTDLTRENRKLRDEIAAYERSKTEDWSDERRQGALLREQMNDLAAEVVKLTATLDGPDSPISKALAAAPLHGKPVNDSGENVTSLAERVRALQKVAAAG